MRKQCKRNERQATPTPNRTEQLFFSMNFSTWKSSLHLNSSVLNKAGWHFYTISQTGKQRTSSTAEAKESSTFPSLCSYIHGRNRPVLFSNLTANFHYIPLLSQTAVIPKAQLGMYRNTERSHPFLRKPSVESPMPPAILHRPHKPTQDFKDELTMQLFPTTTSGA